jgi:D-glycero-beta-D-manno-heptose 1-phosphate adenylyltransferase
MTIIKKRVEFILPSHASCIQFDVKAGEIEQNIESVKKGLEKLDPQPGTLVVLPELWAAGFHYESLAEQCRRSEEINEVLIGLAKKYTILFAGSLPEESFVQEKATYFNTLYFTDGSGTIGQYRKQQLFSPMGENVYFFSGSNPHPVTTDLGMMGGLVCFDLRFPDLARSQANQGASIIVISAQWPTARRLHWKTLVQARAIENQVYVVACNRFGETDGTDFGGHSMIIAPSGEVLAEAGDHSGEISAALDPAALSRARSLFSSAGVRLYRSDDRNKISDLPSLKEKVKNYKKAGSRVVFTNGCFDILHEGHATYLEAARKTGDYLIVGLNSDSSIKAIKGPGRPVNNEVSRARLLAALGCVDHIVLFSEDTPLELIKEILPGVLVKGADWPVDTIVGAKEVLAAGGEVINIDMVEGFSTTGLIEQIKKKKP